jgi:hypothetical protein
MPAATIARDSVSGSPLRERFYRPDPAGTPPNLPRALMHWAHLEVVVGRILQIDDTSLAGIRSHASLEVQALNRKMSPKVLEFGDDPSKHRIWASVDSKHPGELGRPEQSSILPRVKIKPWSCQASRGVRRSLSCSRWAWSATTVLPADRAPRQAERFAAAHSPVVAKSSHGSRQAVSLHRLEEGKADAQPATTAT